MRFLVAILLLCTAQAEANLQVFPTRVVLSDRERVAQLSVRHMGTTPMRYRISTVLYRMQPDGAMRLAEKPTPDDKYAAEYFRFSPRQVNLQPNVEQVVRIMLSKPAGLAAGEYRAHLYFEGMEEAASTKKSAEEGKASMDLKARMAVAIPVIVQNGEVKVEAKIENLQLLTLPDGSKGFQLELLRTGNAFAHGDFAVFFKPKEGAEEHVAQVNAVSSYIPKRLVAYPFNLSKKEIHAGTLRVEFHAPEREGSKLLGSLTKEIP